MLSNEHSTFLFGIFFKKKLCVPRPTQNSSSPDEMVQQVLHMFLFPSVETDTNDGLIIMAQNRSVEERMCTCHVPEQVLQPSGALHSSQFAQQVILPPEKILGNS
jgi:hypothetical protein